MITRILMRAVAIAGMLTVLPTGADAQTVAERDETRIRQVWSTLDQLWNGRDAMGFSELFTADASFVFVDREQALEGRAAIYSLFADQFLSRAAEIRHRTTVSAIREVAAGVRAVDGQVEILRTESGDLATAEVIRTFAIFALMTADGDTWIIDALRVFMLPVATGTVR